MHAFLTTARWLALTAGLMLLGRGILSADVSSMESTEIPILYSTYLGGSNYEFGHAIAVDEDGIAYVAGATTSLDWGIEPPLPGPPDTPGPLRYGAGFVIKISSIGQSLARYSLGGPFRDWAQGVAVNATGLYVIGTTTYPEYVSSTFIAKLPHAWPGPSYFEDVGSLCRGHDIAVDTLGNAYVAGLSSRNPRDYCGDTMVIAKVDGSGSEAYLWGFGGYLNVRLEVDAVGNLYVTGSTQSPNFPLANPVQSALGGYQDAFVMKLDPSGEILYSTFLGGSGLDTAADIAVSPEGYAYVTGTTESADFPITADALQPELKGSSDMFVAELGPDGSLIYSTFLGGHGSDSVAGITLDPVGGLYLAGPKPSYASPVSDPGQICFDNFIARLDLQAGTLRSICFPGTAIKGLAVDRHGDVYLTGDVLSSAFPVVNALQPSPGGRGDAFVARLAFNRPPDCSGATASPAALSPPNGKLIPVSVHGVTEPDGDPVTLKITAVHQDEPMTSRSGFDASGVGTPAAMVRADRKGGGDGRVYHLRFEALDDKGATCTGTVTVCVPHDQRPGAPCGDGGPLFDAD
jgi:hypothetical protein